jgi:hypothetical protein
MTVFAGALLLSFLLYFPVLNNTFLSDDYDSLYRIIIKREILFKEYLRPITDLSFLFNYFFSGLNATAFYVFNIVIHAINVWMLYRIAGRYKMFEGRQQEMFVYIAALLFAIYPFHSECIVWLTGRLSSIACLCALIAIYVILGDMLPWKKRTVAIVAYFIGLHAYESILLLPLILIVLQWRKGISRKALISECLIWGTVMVLYFLWKYLIAGVLYSRYADHMVSNHLIQYIITGLKTLGRSVLPPEENSLFMAVLFAGATIFLVFLHYRLIKTLQSNKEQCWKYGQLALAFFIAILVPALFGVSTRTSEGDRLLYFPSCFLALMFSSLLLVLLKKNSYRWIVLSLLASGALYLIVESNARWRKASGIMKEVLSKVEQAGEKQVLLINLPDELEGAFVFRNGFYNSLIIRGIDTSRVTVSHYLKRLEYLPLKDEIQVVEESSKLFIYPSTYILDNQTDIYEVRGIHNEYITTLRKKNSVIYYWNNKELVKLF